MALSSDFAAGIIQSVCCHRGGVPFKAWGVQAQLDGTGLLPSATQNGEPDWVIKGLKLDKRAGDMYSEGSKIFYLFAEDTRGVVKASPLQRRQSARRNNKEVITYEIDEKDLDRIKKLVFLPEKYEPRRIAIRRP